MKFVIKISFFFENKSEIIFIEYLLIKSLILVLCFILKKHLFKKN